MSRESGEYIKSLRKITGLTQQAFSGKYNISKRTVEEWETGRREAPDYVWALLERAVRQDYDLPWKFSVVQTIGENEHVRIVTYNRFVAIKLARTIADQIERNELDDEVEVRLYNLDGKYEVIDHTIHVKFIYYVNGIEEQESIFMGLLNPTKDVLEKLMNGELKEKDGNIFRIERKEI